MVADESFIYGQLIADCDDLFWCDAENFEILMRFQRASRRAHIEPRPHQNLPGFWASLHRLHGMADEAALIYALENLRGYPASVSTWIYDLFGARLQNFAAHQFDDVFTRLGFAWQGVGTESITIAYPEDLEMLAQQAPLPDFASAFVDAQAKYTFSQIATALDQRTSELNHAWWQAVWQGQLSCDSIAPLLQGMDRKYQIRDTTQAVTSRRRLQRTPRGWPGNWSLATPITADDPLTLLEVHKERVRLLLDRYGFVNREIVNRENLASHTPDKRWRWRDAFRALRIMELAGEVVTGHVFSDLSTPQFIAPRTLSALQANMPELSSFWFSATDPVSPCGLSLDWPELPQRRAGNYLSFNANKLALVVENQGKDLTYHVAWDDADIDKINAVLTHLVEHRRIRLQIQTINGESARTSPFLEPLERVFNVMLDHKQLTLEPSF